MFRLLKQLLGTEERAAGEAPPITEIVDAIKPHQKRVFGTRDFSLHVVGTSHYGQAINAATAGKKSYGEDGDRNYIPVVLETEPENPYDSNAIKVMSVNRETIGYLPREEAAKYKTAVQLWEERGKWVGCEAAVYKKGGGTGVWLDLDAPETILG